MTDILSLLTRAETDSDAQELWSDYLASLARGANVLAHGNPGTGKTTAAMFHELGARKSARHQCRPTDTSYDVLGAPGIKDGSSYMIRGIGWLAVEHGYRLVLDEFNYASEDVKALVYSLGDGKPFALADGTILTPHPELQIVLTMNEDPWSLYPPESGIRDRFPFLLIPEPSEQALATLPEFMRESARRSVRAGFTGLRAWQHWCELLADSGYEPESVLQGLDESGTPERDGNGLVMPSAVKRERTIQRRARSVFGERAPEIVRAFRVAACRDPEMRASIAPAPESFADRLVRDAYEHGRSDGLAEGLAEDEHEHDADECDECRAIRVAAYESGAEDGYSSGYESGRDEYEHRHSAGECEACSDIWDSGYSSCECEHEHETHSSYGCPECIAVRDRGRDEMRDEMLSALEEIGSTVLGSADASALVELISDECEA